MKSIMTSVCWWFVIVIIQNILQINAETRFCGGSKSCVCTNNDLCTLQCNGKDQCKGSDMTLGCRPGYPCNVICNSAGEENACEDALIDATEATDLTVACHDKQACLSAHIKCGSGNCNVICISTDSTGSNCDGLTLRCGAGDCVIQCDSGPDMCTNVNVLGTEQSQSFQCIGVSDECKYIDARIAPFTRATVPPTGYTFSPTLRPSSHPTKSPILNPTAATNAPTHRPSPNPTERPSVSPTLSPTLYPTRKPTAPPTTKRPTSKTNAPSTSPTNEFPTPKPTPRPTPRPTKKPTPRPTTTRPTHSPLVPGTPTRSPVPTPVPSKYIPVDYVMETTEKQPTKQIYYVVGDITSSPTKYQNNIYAHEDPIDTINTNKMKSMVMENKLYTAIGAGVVACCMLLICIRCCGCGKRVARPAKYSPPHKEKKLGLHSPKPSLICVKSISGASVRANRSFVAPPRAPPPDGSGASQVEMEGIYEADIALPGTIGVIGPAGGYMNGNGPRRIHTRANACIDDKKYNMNNVEKIEEDEDDENDVVQIMDEMGDDVMDDEDTDETEDLGDLNHHRSVLRKAKVRTTVSSFADFSAISISHMKSDILDDHHNDPEIEFLDDRAIRQ